MTNLVCTFHRAFTDIEISSVQRRAREQNNVHEKNAKKIIYYIFFLFSLKQNVSVLTSRKVVRFFMHLHIWGIIFFLFNYDCHRPEFTEWRHNRRLLLYTKVELFFQYALCWSFDVAEHIWVNMIYTTWCSNLNEKR